MRILLCCLFAVSWLSISANAAEVEYYTWVDENGVTNYAERDPRGINATHITSLRRFGQTYSNNQTQQTNPTAPTPTSRNPREVDPDALIADQRDALAAELASTRKSNCEIGKRNLTQLQIYRRIRVSDEQGENRVLSDQEKTDKINQARTTIRENCSG